MERIELKGDPYNKFSQFISMHADKVESSGMELLSKQCFNTEIDYC